MATKSTKRHEENLDPTTVNNGSRPLAQARAHSGARQASHVVLRWLAESALFASELASCLHLFGELREKMANNPSVGGGAFSETSGITGSVVLQVCKLFPNEGMMRAFVSHCFPFVSTLGEAIRREDGSRRSEP
jgi:hypothetical protein